MRTPACHETLSHPHQFVQSRDDRTVVVVVWIQTPCVRPELTGEEVSAEQVGRQTLGLVQSLGSSSLSTVLSVQPIPQDVPWARCPQGHPGPSDIRPPHVWPHRTARNRLRGPLPLFACHPRDECAGARRLCLVPTLARIAQRHPSPEQDGHAHRVGHRNDRRIKGLSRRRSPQATVSATAQASS